MALVTVSIQRTQTVVNKTGKVTITPQANPGNLLDSYSENFPLDTADGYILDVLLGKAKEMMRDLAFKQIPASFSFDVDSDQMRLKRLFDL